MRALKTIVATAVIVFTLTTVAMAGVQHLGWQTGPGEGSHAGTDQTSGPASTRATYTVRLTERQLERLAAALAQGRHATVRRSAHHAAHTKQTSGTHHAAAHHEVTRTSSFTTPQTTASPTCARRPAGTAVTQHHADSDSHDGEQSGHDGAGCD